jgi:hypothetical protein
VGGGGEQADHVRTRKMVRLETTTVKFVLNDV